MLGVCSCSHHHAACLRYRPDLGQPEDWNAVDVTPQEPSPLAPNQPYRAGPAYVPYIQSDTRTANYDTYFILAEVNARGICPITGRPLPTNVGYAVVTKLKEDEARYTIITIQST